VGFKRRQLTCKDVKTILAAFGFECCRQKGSHEHWKGFVNGQAKLVTVDCPKAPFSSYLMASMVRQSGYSIDEWYRKLDG
jgi:predicted RNA binding protein YcfA (HicA-like mRNA interferase family)